MVSALAAVPPTVHFLSETFFIKDVHQVGDGFDLARLDVGYRVVADLFS